MEGEGGGGGGKGLKSPPPPMISRQNYPSWSGAENRDKDQYTLIRSNTLIEQSRPHKNVFLKVALQKNEESCLQQGSNQVALTLTVGILPLYQVFPGGYRLFCTVY